MKLSSHDICWKLRGGEKIRIVHCEKGEWIDTFIEVFALLDMHHLKLASGESLDLGDYGKCWWAYDSNPEEA